MNPVTTFFEKAPAPVLVLLAIVSIQFSAALAIDLFDDLGPAGVVMARLALSSVFLVVLFRPKPDRLILTHYKLLLGYGACLCSMNWFFYESIARIPLGLTVAIEFMGPLIVGVISSHRKIDLLWMAIAATGLFILSPEIGENLDIVGVMYAVAAGIGWGSFVLLSKRLTVTFPGSSGLVYGMIVATVFIAPFAALDVLPVFGSIELMGFVILLALLSTTIPFSFEFAALKSLSPHTYSILITLEPAVAAMIGAIVLGDSIGVTGVVAVACVSIAALGATITQKKNEPSPIESPTDHG